MTNPCEQALQKKEEEVLRACSVILSFSSGSTKAPDSSAPETTTQTNSSAEVWQILLTACRQIPKSLQHAFVVQVLVSILEDQEISIRTLQEAVQKGLESVQRVEEARRYRRDREMRKRLASAA
jgi:hypothetical protein